MLVSNNRRIKFLTSLFLKRTLTFATLILLASSLIIVVSDNLVQGADIVPYKGEVFPTWTYVSVSPPVEGVGQTALIVFWSNMWPPTAVGQYGDRWTFTVNVVRPDGTNETLGPFESDPVGTGYTYYTPDQTGEYLLQAIMEEHVIDGGASRGLISPGGIGYWPGGSPYVLSYGPSGPVYLDPVGDVFLGSISEPQNMTVVEDQIPYYQETPLPNDYWTRPVYDTNRNWGMTIMGEWLNAAELNQFGNGGRYNPFTTGPTSSHILWTYPYWNGGIAGGVAGLGVGGTAVSYYSGQSYESFGAQPFMILNGRAYVTIQTNPRQGFYELDLTTGEQVYYSNSSGPVSGAGGGFGSTGSRPYGIPAFGQILDMETPNQHGAISYYWVTSTPTGAWDMYDDFSNQYICSISDIPSWIAGGGGFFAPATATSSYGNDGSILRYQIANLGTPANPKLYLQCWNTTQAIMASVYQADLGYIPIIGETPHVTGTPSGSNSYWMWRPGFNVTYNGTLGYSMNVSIPNNLIYQKPGMFGSSPTIQTVIPEDQIVGLYPGSNNGTASIPGQVWALSLKPGEEGKLLYQYNFTAPAGLGDAAAQSQLFTPHDTEYPGGGMFGGNGLDVNASIFWYQNSVYRKWYVYSLTNGNMLWESPPGPQFEFNGMGSVVVYDNMFIDTGGWGGVVAAYDAQTGTPLWNWTAPIVGQGETSYQYTITELGVVSGNGLLYLYSGEHSVNNPIRRDGMIWCLNMTTGDLVWKLTCWPSGSPILGDQKLLVLDNHDNQIYCYGKGPSKTTVETPLGGIFQGESCVIQGQVLDMSPGTAQSEIALRFTGGVPVVSDESEEAWMEYVYRQRPMPTNATGVEVALTLIDPNTNIVNLPSVTSDANGHFSVAYNADSVPGLYTVIANFVGTNSNYPSMAESSFVVIPESTAAPTAPAQANYVTTTDLMTYMAIGVVAIIIAIAIVGALVLRKRP
jgi:hypothetical protein